MKAMKNKFLKRANLFLLLAFLLVGVGACKYDDDALWDKVNSLDDRVTAVEGQLEQTNSGLSAISTILNALQNNIYVESVTETEDGYQIKFSDGESVTIKNGKDGENGKDAPVIGVDEFEGKYYWVRIIDGVKTWLTDEEGNKLPVTGEDAVTPQLKVNADGYWLVSYDGGATFDLLQDENGNPVKAIGEDGKDGVDGTDGNDGTDGDSFFSDVKVEGDELVLTLADGTVLRIAINNVAGVSSPVHETSANYDITYQYNDGVIVLNERAQVYLEKVEEDSILFFSSSTPANILPEVGDIISAKVTEKTPYGLGNEVISRTEEDGLIKCVTSVAPLDDIFEVLELTSSFSLTDLVENEGGFYDEEGNYYEYTIENVDDMMAEAGTYWGQTPSRVSIGSKEALKIPLNKSKEVGPYADLSLIAGGILTFNKSKEDDTFENSVELSVGVLGQLGIRGEKLSDEASYTNKVADLLSLINRTQLFAGTVPIAGGIINLRPFVDFKADIVGKGNVSLGIYRNVSFKCGWTENGWFVKDTSPDFSLESIFDSFKVEGKIEVGPKFAFILGCGLYTKNLAMMLNVEPSLMFGANLGMDAERNDNNLSFNIGGQVANLNLGIDAVGEIYAKLFNHVLYDNEVNVRAWTILQKEIPIFPKLENGSLNVALASEDPLVFNAQYTATGGALAKLLGGMPSMRVDKDDAEVYHIIDGQEINWTTPTTLNYELTGLEKDVTYTAVPCIYIGDACYEWEGVDFSSNEEKIIGKWGINASLFRTSPDDNNVVIAKIEWVDVLTFNEDGTYSYELNPLKKVLCWSDSSGSHCDELLYAYCTGSYVFDNAKRTLSLKVDKIINADGEEIESYDVVYVSNLFGRTGTYEAWIELVESEPRLHILSAGWHGELGVSKFYRLDESQTESCAGLNLYETDKKEHRTDYQLHVVK